MKGIAAACMSVIILAGHSVLLAAQTSSESVNPFNEFMNSDGGVDVSSGNANFSYPLSTLKGRNGMDLDLSLADRHFVLLIG
jgi:hypothetical protein